ncbi:MAG: hypothetical protein II988_05800 [Clostridia bacterium]|nr:hypothetical protein [Clostridia bacterium]
MQSFFKSTLFKCVAVLLAISLIAGGLLAVLNDVLYVTPEERTGRAFTKIYGNAISQDRYQIEIDVDGTDKNINQPYSCVYENVEIGVVEKLYIVDKQNDTDLEYDMIFKTKGYQGYKGGWISTWVKVEVNGSAKSITKVIIDGYEKQTLMSKLGDAFLSKFNVDVTQDILFSSNTKTGNNVVAGATKSANAGCNAVNCALIYMEANA